MPRWWRSQRGLKVKTGLRAAGVDFNHSRPALALVKGGGRRDDVAERVERELAAADARDLILEADRTIAAAARLRSAAEKTLRMFADPIRRAVRG